MIEVSYINTVFIQKHILHEKLQVQKINIDRNAHAFLLIMVKGIVFSRNRFCKQLLNCNWTYARLLV
jgi:hypothetical protein